MPFDNTETLTEFDQDTAILIRVKNLLVEKGWCTCVLEDHHGRHCLNGAILKTIGGGLAASHLSQFTHLSQKRATINRLMSRFRVIINADHPKFLLPEDAMSMFQGNSTASFNNAQTSVEPVLDLLDKAIAQSRP